MSRDFRTLANLYIRELEPYQPGKPTEELERELGIKNAIKLASNENLLGPSPHAIAAGKKVLEHSHIYPDGSCYVLRLSLAKLLKVAPEQLTLGNGSENVIELIVKSYLTRGDLAVTPQYAFMTIPLLIQAAGAINKVIPTQHFQYDLSALRQGIDGKTRLVFIINPNNPTGSYINKSALISLLDSIPPHTLVVLDEAYYEYMDLPDYPQTVALLNQYPNLIITRTFSKAYGLAGIRLGYAISSPEIADILNRARLPFNVNSVASAMAVAAIQDQAHLALVCQLTAQGLQQLKTGLQKLNIAFLPSVANFITLEIKNNALEVYQKLLRKGIIVRPLLPYKMPAHLRVTIGTQQQNALFLQALKEVMYDS